MDEAFKGCVKSAVIAGLMWTSVERVRCREWSLKSVGPTQERRRGRFVFSDEVVRSERHDGRP